MKIQIPKHIRPCGKVEETGEIPENIAEKIYIEDYVVTFFRQAGDRHSDSELTIELYGGKVQEQGRTCLVIYAAGMQGDEKHFQGLERLGYARLNTPRLEEGRQTEEEIRDIQKQSDAVHAVMDREDGSLIFYLKEEGYVKRTDAYYVFYEQNEVMQNYLIAWYRSNLKTEYEKTSDQAAYDFRRLYRERQNELHQNRVMRFMYALSLMLMILCCITGISMLNQYDKMKQMGQSIDHLALAMEERKLPEETEAVIPAMGENVITVLPDGADTVEEAGALSADAVTDEPAIDKTATDESAATDGTVTDESVTAGETAAEQKVYIVKEGDTLAEISRSLYGTSSRIVELCEINQIENPNNIIVGQKILLPQD